MTKALIAPLESIFLVARILVVYAIFTAGPMLLVCLALESLGA